MNFRQYKKIRKEIVRFDKKIWATKYSDSDIVINLFKDFKKKECRRFFVLRDILLRDTTEKKERKYRKRIEKYKKTIYVDYGIYPDTSPQSENKDKEYRGAKNLCFAIIK